MTACTHCGCALPLGAPPRGFEGDHLCRSCDAAETRALLSECNGEDLKKMRRRMEDAVRKDRGLMIRLAADLAAEGRIKIDDLI